MGALNLKDFGARGDANTAHDDTQALVNALALLATNPAQYQNAIFVPAGVYPISDAVAGYNNVQYVNVTGGTSGSFQLNINNQLTPIINWTGTTSTNAANLMNAMSSSLPSVANNVTVVPDPVTGWYMVTYALSLGGPAVSVFGTPTGGLSVSAFAGNLNRQAINVTGPTTGSLTLTVTVGTSGISPGISTRTTASISYDSTNTSGTAGNIQSALGTLTNVGMSNVACTFNGTNYVVTFAPSLGAPIMTGTSSTLTLSITTLLSGAAIVIPNLLGLRIFGEGSALADYDAAASNPNLLPSSRSAFMYRGTTNGILLHLLGCNNVTLENIALWGATSTGAMNKARTALLFSSNPNNAAGQQGGTGLACRSALSHLRIRVIV